MAINPIALYSDPVKYREVLEKCSHLFDDEMRGFETAIKYELSYLKTEIDKVNTTLMDESLSNYDGAPDNSTNVGIPAEIALINGERKDDLGLVNAKIRSDSLSNYDVNLDIYAYVNIPVQSAFAMKDRMEIEMMANTFENTIENSLKGIILKDKKEDSTQLKKVLEGIIAETQKSFIKESKMLREQLEKCIYELNRLLPAASFYFNIYLPSSEVCTAIQQMWAYEEEVSAIENPYQLTAEEVYDQLIGANELIADKLIRRISCPMITRKQLLDAYNKHDRDTFISVLEDPANNCDCTEIFRFANTKGAVKAAKNINTSLFRKELYQNILQKYGIIRDLLHVPLAALDGSNTEGMRLPQYGNLFLTEIEKKEDITKILVGLKKERNALAAKYGIINDKIDIHVMKEIYHDVINQYSKYNDIERDVLKSILTRPEGIELYNKYKAEYEKERLEAQEKEEQPEEQDDETADVVVEKSPVSEEASSKTAFTPTLDYSDSAYITFEEFAGLDVSEDNNKYYLDSKVFTIDESQARWSYETTTRLYEFLASFQITVDTKGGVPQKSTLIEHTPDNYYSFLVRMTGRIDHNRELKTINLLAQRPDILAYFIGRAVYKRKDATGINHEDVGARNKKARYENGIWEKTFDVFFNPGDKVENGRASEWAAIKMNPRKDIYKSKCNELCKELFGELK